MPSSPGERLAWTRLLGSARGLALAMAAARHRGPLLVVTRSVSEANQLEDEIRFYRTDPALPVLPFPDWECLPYDIFSPHQELVSQRLSTLYRLPGLSRGVVIAAVSTLLYRLAPREYVAGHSLMLSAGERLDLDPFREQLVRSGYHAVSQVMEPGEYAVRGGLVDLYPVGAPRPYRIDLFGDTVDSIREFDPETQRSGASLSSVQLLPAREYPLTESAIQRFRQTFRARFEGDPQKVGIYRDVSKGIAPAGAEFFLPLFFERTASLFDYLPGSGVCVLEDGTEQAAADFLREARGRYEQLRYDVERPLLPPEEIFIGPEAFDASLKGYPCVTLRDFSSEAASSGKTVDYGTAAPAELRVDHHSAKPYGSLYDYVDAYAGRALIVAETAGRRETLHALLQDHGLDVRDVAGWAEFLKSDARLGLTAAPLDRGLALTDPAIAVIAESQLYGERAVQRRRRQKAERDPAAIIRSLAELQVGDAVVHEDHGVGRYLGLQTIDVGDGPTEFICLEYADGDKLYLPILSLHLITRYTGTDPEQAPLHKLGGEAWEKAKRRALEKAYDAAAELLEVYALRAARKGHAFNARDVTYHGFAESFPFEETPDQARAIDEVMRDMETEKPMDRLVCGDVGFGKTEVAMRAAFLAVHGGKQVAVLVPTTLLAAQHYQNFKDRFAGTPYRVELLSRFRSASEAMEVLEGLKAGKVDIVIGTHRLLQTDVRFDRLGLLILDEEHRFGVRQKERLKQLRAEVDILTLTATPIPRTLNMALANLRDISIIATAPEGRLAIKTLVAEWNRDLIREACLREIRRGGQVYYLHNEVRTIERAARELKELIPEAEIGVAHGQMPERELERVMLDFYHRRYNILVCSTIIESGIDVPTANTIVIERADKFGLAQLHQLRGRVGRSHHRAYAYLLIPGRNAITADARKRLEAIESLEELGAGFALASHDLEIRGAGELLGEQQSGEIDEVGFALYSELLERAVRSLRAGEKLPAKTESREVEINLHAPALLPENYLPDVHMRLVLYKRIASAESLEALQTLQEEIVDRFGVLPEAGKRLFKAAELKVRAAPLGIKKVDAGAKGARIEFVEKPPIDPGAIIRLLQSAPRTYRLDGPNRLRILTEMPDPESRVKTITKLFDTLAPARVEKEELRA
ncbi:transcription-repair coupling factor [Sulfurifustis variabilis]|uniref:Transcription-repair-coupling factor n=1 Tax=Sulfurifustis variabilis TaxID=1675686 RepID=A0A1B4VC13_9GAMM|nr:transcription-repair coupling factor [Sulfurifustis variabilis]